MALLQWLLLGLAITILIYVGIVLGLVLAGRHTDARALARFIPDCLVLFTRLLADSRVPAWRKILLAGVVLYLASPIDLVPDFIPVAGQLDDAIVVALALRMVLRSGGESLLHEHWPGPDQSLRVMSRLTYATQPAGRPSASGD